MSETPYEPQKNADDSQSQSSKQAAKGKSKVAKSTDHQEASLLHYRDLEAKYGPLDQSASINDPFLARDLASRSELVISPSIAEKIEATTQKDRVDLSPSFTAGLYGGKDKKRTILEQFLAALGLRE